MIALISIKDFLVDEALNRKVAVQQLNRQRLGR